MHEVVEMIALGELSLSVRTWGDSTSPPTLLLHALGHDSETWREVALRLGEDRFLIAPDARGHGGSDRPGDYSFENMTRDVTDLLDHLDLPRVSVIGHSMGGTVAYLLAERCPQRVDRLVLEDTPPPLGTPRPPLERPEVELLFDWEVVPPLMAQLANPDPSWWADLNRIAAPTLIVAGGAASPIPQDKLVEVADSIPTCRLVTVEAGHHVHATLPDEFVANVKPFLDS